jgi:hypothetical protein
LRPNRRSFEVTVRIAHVTSSQSGFALGAVVMRFEQHSDTDAEWVYGDGFLRLYDADSVHSPQLVRISNRRVLSCSALYEITPIQ